MGNKSCCEQETNAPGNNATFSKPGGQAGGPPDVGVPAISDPPPQAPEVTPPNQREVAQVTKDESDLEKAAAPASAQDMSAPPAPEVEPPAPAAGQSQFPSFEATLKPEAGAPFSFLMEQGFESLGICVVGKFSGGPAAAWNSSQPDDSTRLTPGDRIVQVNGAPCKRADLVSAASSGSPFTITIERWPDEYVVQLKRETADAKFGMKVELVERSNGMRVLRVGEIRKGVLEDWNAKAKEEGRLHEIVTPGTALLEVCGEKGNHDAMMSKLQGREVVLSMKRPEVGTIERLGGAQPPVAG